MIIEAEYTRLHCSHAQPQPPKLDAVGGWKETPLGLLRFDACLVLLTDDNAGAADTRRRTGLIFQQNVYLEMLMLTRGDDSNDIANAVVTMKTTWRDMVEIDQQRVVAELERHRSKQAVVGKLPWKSDCGMAPFDYLKNMCDEVIISQWNG